MIIAYQIDSKKQVFNNTTYTVYTLSKIENGTSVTVFASTDLNRVIDCYQGIMRISTINASNIPAGFNDEGEYVGY